MKQKPLRITDIIVATLLILNSLIIALRFGSSAVGQIIFNIILSLLLVTMSFTKKPSDVNKSQSLSMFYITRVYLFILLFFLSLICIYNFIDGVKNLLRL